MGVDGSEGARRALAWAVAEARRADVPLRVVHAWWTPPELAAHGLVAGTADDTDRRRAGEQLLDQLLGELDLDGIEVDTDVVGEHPATALIDRSASADRVVVGSRGLGGFEALLLGSVTQQVVQHAQCPVVVVPPIVSAARERPQDRT